MLRGTERLTLKITRPQRESRDKGTGTQYSTQTDTNPDRSRVKVAAVFLCLLYTLLYQRGSRS